MDSGIIPSRWADTWISRLNDRKLSVPLRAEEAMDTLAASEFSGPGIKTIMIFF
jgi:hypothetical protein